MNFTDKNQFQISISRKNSTDVQHEHALQSVQSCGSVHTTLVEELNIYLKAFVKSTRHNLSSRYLQHAEKRKSDDFVTNNRER